MTHSSKSSTAYARFIPREELRGFAAWTPDAFGQAPTFAQPVTHQPAQQNPAESGNAELLRMLVEGQQALAAAISQRDGSNTQSPFVVLAAR